MAVSSSTPYGPKNDAFNSAHTHAVLRLADLYGMDGIRVELISHLSASWPSTLGEYDLNEHDIQTQIEQIRTQEALERTSVSSEGDTTLQLAPQHQDEPETESLSPSPTPPAALCLPDPVKAILLARECGLSNILPCAFYSLSRIPLNQIASSASYRATSPHDSVTFKCLSPEDLCRLIYGRERLQARARKFSCKPLTVNPAHAGCLREGTPCNDGITRYWSQRVKSIVLLGMEDPLGALGRMQQDQLRHHEICGPCERAVKEKVHHIRAGWWRHLSSDFLLWSDTVPDAGDAA